jgi:hypothetical protein
VSAQTLEILFAPSDRQSPEHALIWLLWNPQVEGAYDLRIQLDRRSLLADLKDRLARLELQSAGERRSVSLAVVAQSSPQLA